jgi:uncharacterized membrane protein YdbT with pleckstrin-like domain
MSYVDSQLLPGEQVVYRSKLHWKIFLVPGFFSAILLVAAIAAWAGRSHAGALAFAALAVLLFAVPFVKRATSEFAVTDKRIVVKLGVLTTRTVELLHAKVEAISVNQSLFGKMLGYGDITVTGSGGTRELFQGVESPLQLRHAVQAATAS